MPHDVISLLLEAGEEHADNIALRQGDISYSYKEMASNIVTIAANLQARGVKQGDRFLFSVRPNPDGILLALGIVASGGVVVFADPGTAPELFDSRIKLTNPKYAAAESLLYAASNPLLKPMMRKRGLTMPNYSKLPVEHFYSGSWLPGTPFSAVSVHKLLKKPKVELQPTDPTDEAIIAFTSGTTEHPKAVVHSRASLGSGMHAFVDLCRINKNSLVYTDHFMFGVTAMMCGGQWEIPEAPPAKDAAAWLDALLEKQPTHTFLVPADTTLMLNEIESRGGLSGASPLGTLAMGAAPVLPPLIRRVNELMPETAVLAVYGMTEILPVAVVEGAGKIAYVNGDLAGGVILGVTARIDNLEGEDSGELILSGDGLMLGYLGEERKNEHRTGDIATMTEDGQLVLLGRKKDMLIRANKNIYPGLYEPGIMQLSGISSCAIVGVPDKYGEDIVVLVVVPAEKDQNERRLRRKVEAHLNHVMDLDALPDVVIVQSEIPLSGRSSKPNRIQLRKDVSAHSEVETILRERAKHV
jgi:acyl-CoA synthetase (AMP-forming)/AMP-acid ligase II